MAASIDPVTGAKLPASALQRVLFVCAKVLVYKIPPLPSTKGHQATLWTADPARHIFTARLRVVETSYDDDEEEGKDGGDGDGTITAAVLLEDPSSGTLFAAAPYTSGAEVEPVVDSSRFFAVTVRDPQGRKALLGIGFEERTDAFDFGIALQDVKKSVTAAATAPSNSSGSSGMATAGSSSSSLIMGEGGATNAGCAGGQGTEQKRDLSLKEGETITVSFGGRFGRRAASGKTTDDSAGGGGGGSPGSGLSGFSLPPPPGSGGSSSGGGVGGGSFSLPPPPAPSGRSPRSSAYLAPAPGSGGSSKSGEQEKKKSARELGFDDGQFDEFA